MLKNQPEAVVNAIKEIMKNSAQAAQEEKQISAEKLNKKYENMKPVQEIAHVLKAMDKADKANQEVKKQKGLVGNQHKLDKNKNGKLDSHDFKLLRKEETEQTDEARHSDPGKRVLRDVEAMEKRAKPSMAELDKKKMMSASDKDKLAKTAELVKREKAMKEEIEQVDEISSDLAMKAARERVSRLGKPTTQKDVNVMKQGGGNPYERADKAVERAGARGADKKSVSGLKGAVTTKFNQSIAAAKAKRAAAASAQRNEELELEEGRGRPPKKPKQSADDGHEYGGKDNSKEPDQHIHVRLGAAADQDKGADHKFDNGKTHHIPQHVAKAVYSGLNRMKPDVRAKVHDHIQKSHENLMQVHTMLAGKK